MCNFRNISWSEDIDVDDDDDANVDDGGSRQNNSAQVSTTTNDNRWCLIVMIITYIVYGFGYGKQLGLPPQSSKHYVSVILIIIASN